MVHIQSVISYRYIFSKPVIRPDLSDMFCEDPFSQKHLSNGARSYHFFNKSNANFFPPSFQNTALILLIYWHIYVAYIFKSSNEIET